jgi:hypothetical protein
MPSNNISWVYDDGGRKAAGFKNDWDIGDCACRAIAIVTRRSYMSVYNHLTKLMALDKSYFYTKKKDLDPSYGCLVHVWEEVLKNLKWKYKATKCLLRNVPNGRLVVWYDTEPADSRGITWGHSVASIDRVLHDTWDSSDDGDLHINGYWRAY